MFLGYQNGKIMMVAKKREELEDMPLMEFDRIEQTSDEYELINGQYINKNNIPKETENELICKARKAAYPLIEDQLDMLYWDKVNGTHLWEYTISQVKRAYPKK